ncbi:MAG: hypothetical protein GC151_08720 [Betaproteobacteria bacterium]|nr:hypothetical protein [Betaproteobacteria bacterium]
MALKSTIFKAELQVSDLDRGHYGTHALTIARHPSETDERMMVRIVAFALHAREMLSFGKGLSSEGEPALWRKDLTGAVEDWIEVGLPDPREIRKACGRSPRVSLYAYGGRSVGVWWSQNGSELARLGNLAVFELPPDATSSLAALAARTMSLQCTIQEGHVWFAAGDAAVAFEVVALKLPGS